MEIPPEETRGIVCAKHIVRKDKTVDSSRDSSVLVS